MFAVLKTGDKQYKVQSGDMHHVEKLAADAGETIQFNEVLILGGDATVVGAPFVADAGVQAEVKPFLGNIARRLSEAQLVISRAGASSVADISVIGRPSILIPFAAAMADHQTANARGLVEACAAILVPESAMEAESFVDQIAAVLEQPQAATRMAHNALA